MSSSPESESSTRSGVSSLAIWRRAGTAASGVGSDIGVEASTSPRPQSPRLHRVVDAAWHALSMAAVELPGKDVLGIRAANPGSVHAVRHQLLDRRPRAGVADRSRAGARRAHRGAAAGARASRRARRHPAHPRPSPTTPRASRRCGDGFPAPSSLPRAETSIAGSPAATRSPDSPSSPPRVTLPDHLAFVADRVAFTGDAVLGEGSVFVDPDPGALAGYLRGLQALRGWSSI